MACRLFGAKPLSESVLPYHQLDPEEHISVKFYHDLKVSIQENALFKCRLWNGGHFVSASMGQVAGIWRMWWNNAELSLWPGIKKLRFPVFVLIEPFNES